MSSAECSKSEQLSEIKNTVDVLFSFPRASSRIFVLVVKLAYFDLPKNIFVVENTTLPLDTILARAMLYIDETTVNALTDDKARKEGKK